ncbi:MAG: Anaphase-promoting complex, cyclosome, subunit 3 [Candidatus Sumerlaeota bacterium]|nr:Anaphase-promoting complex, cyclosome, subunit 3 [Candidatus Sumerlaeota bacterium]
MADDNSGSKAWPILLGCLAVVLLLVVFICAGGAWYFVEVEKQRAEAERQEKIAALVAEGRRAMAKDSPETAALAFARALELAPGDETLTADLGVALALSGHYEKALPLLGDIVEHDAENVKAWMALAEALEATGDEAKAIEAHGMAYALQPGEETLMPYARLLAIYGHDEEAVEALKGGVESDASVSIAARALLADLLLQQDDELAAMALVEEVLKALETTPPDSVRVSAARDDVMTLARQLAARGRDTDSAQLLLALLAVSPGNPAVMCEAAGLVRESGRPARAAWLATRCVESGWNAPQGSAAADLFMMSEEDRFLDAVVEFATVQRGIGVSFLGENAWAFSVPNRVPPSAIALEDRWARLRDESLLLAQLDPASSLYRQREHSHAITLRSVGYRPDLRVTLSEQFGPLAGTMYLAGALEDLGASSPEEMLAGAATPVEKRQVVLGVLREELPQPLPWHELVLLEDMLVGFEAIGVEDVTLVSVRQSPEGTISLKVRFVVGQQRVAALAVDAVNRLLTGSGAQLESVKHEADGKFVVLLGSEGLARE